MENGKEIVTDLSVSSYSNSEEHCDVLHARKDTNYVTAVDCLFNAAIIIKNNKNNSQFRNAAKKYFEKAYMSSKQSDTEKKKDIEALEKALHVSCFFALDADTKEADYIANGVDANRASLQLLGMAIHVVGDSYAHREILPKGIAAKEEKYKREYKKLKQIDHKFKNFSNLMKRIKKEKITTSGLRNHAKKGENKTIHKRIADNTGFLRKRHKQGTYYAVNKLLELYVDSDCKNVVYAYCPIISYEDYDLRLDNLVKNIKDTGYTLEELSLVSVSQWKKLSR